MWSPFAARYGGQTLAHEPVQVDVPGALPVNRYKVRPAPVVRTVPTWATLAVDTWMVFVCREWTAPA